MSKRVLTSILPYAMRLGVGIPRHPHLRGYSHQDRVSLPELVLYSPLEAISQVAVDDKKQELQFFAPAGSLVSMEIQDLQF